MTGAVAGGAINRAGTGRLAEAVRTELRGIRSASVALDNDRNALQR